MKSAARPTTSLNDLIGQSSVAGLGSSGAGLTAATTSRRQGNFDDLFGSKPHTPAPVGPETSVVVPSLHVATPSADNFDAGRILRLEKELERVNRELEDTKRRKREDEEDLENLWKSKLDVQNKEHSEMIESLKTTYKAQTLKLQEEHLIEVNRLKENFNRQLDNITSSANQVGDFVAVVEKVDVLSNSIDKIAADVAESTNKVSIGQTSILRLQEERLNIQEQRLAEDVAALKLEQNKVQELNLCLKDMVKNQHNDNEKEKWRMKEEWNRLRIEKQLFKENQERIVENMQKERTKLLEESNIFRKNQNDLLFRINSERELLDQEKNEFFAKRDQDIKRIKSEAYELDLKSQQISIADQHITEMKLVTESKYRQLQHLETLLTAECSEIERIRNEQKVIGTSIIGNSAFNLKLDDNKQRITRDQDFFGSNNSNQNSHRRPESVRASLKKHYENLEKYAGQKVATVAPQNN